MTSVGKCMKIPSRICWASKWQNDAMEKMGWNCGDFFWIHGYGCGKAKIFERKWTLETRVRRFMVQVCYIQNRPRIMNNWGTCDSRWFIHCFYPSRNFICFSVRLVDKKTYFSHISVFSTRLESELMSLQSPHDLNLRFSLDPFNVHKKKKKKSTIFKHPWTT